MPILLIIVAALALLSCTLTPVTPTPYPTKPFHLIPTPMITHPVTPQPTKELIIPTPIEYTGFFANTESCFNQNNLGESKKKEIYYQLVVEQDKAVASTRWPDYKAVDRTIMRKFGISDKDVQCITIEGTMNNWPIPEL